MSIDGTPNTYDIHETFQKTIKGADSDCSLNQLLSLFSTFIMNLWFNNIIHS